MTDFPAQNADLPSLIVSLQAVKDPRDNRGVRHLLIDILVMSVLAVLCGANSFAILHTFAVQREQWLRQSLQLPAGIPSQDTFERIFQAIDAEVFQNAFLGWLMQLPRVTLSEGEREILAIDGKTSRGTATGTFAALHTISVYSVQHQLVLEAMTVPEKANEITVLPELIEALSPTGGIITTDAMGCQKKVTKTIRQFPGTDYLLALKGNHATLEADAAWLFANNDKYGWEGVDHSYACTEERSHGRDEQRECWLVRDIDVIEGRKQWTDLNALVRVRATRRVKEKKTVEERFYITSLTGDAAIALRASRLHWGIENSLHWVLDVVFGDDASKVKDKNAARVWTTLRQVSAHILRRPVAGKGSLETKRFKAALDTNYLGKLLN